MSVRLSNDIWREVLSRFLSVQELCRMSATDRFFRELLSGRSSRVWQSMVARHCAPFTLDKLASYDWKHTIADVWPHLHLLARHVALLHVGRCAALPASNPESVAFFLYIYWTGERSASFLRIIRFAPENLLDVDLPRGTLSLHAHCGSDSLPMLCWGSVSSLVDLVMVNRRVPGNRKVVASFQSLQQTRGGERQGRRVNVASEVAEGCQLHAYVSTPSRAQYAALGKAAFGDESHYFNLGGGRSADVNHAEAKYFGSSEVDYRLRQSTAGLPNVPAGGARDFFCVCPIELIGRETLQLMDEWPHEEGEEGAM